MRSSSYHSRDLSSHSSPLRASTRSAAVPSPAFTHKHTSPQHHFNHQEQERAQNELHFGNQPRDMKNSHQYSHSATARTSPQHIHAATIQQAQEETFLSKSPFSNVEQAGKDILRSARQKLDARRKTRPISVEQKIPPPLTPNVLVATSPSVGNTKRRLGNNDKQLQSTPVIKLRHSAATQQPKQFAYQKRIETSESASLSLRSSRSLSPSRVSSVMDRSNCSVDSKPRTPTTPTRSTDSGRGGALFHSKYYAAARAARLRDQKEQERQRSQSVSRSVSFGDESASKHPTREASPLRSHSQRSRSLSRSFTSAHKSDASKLQGTAQTHQNGHFPSTPQRSQSLSRSFPPTKEFISSNSVLHQHTSIPSRQTSTPFQGSPPVAQHISRSFSSTIETAASTRTTDSSKQQANIPTRQASHLPPSQRNLRTMPPRKNSDNAKAPSSPQTYTSSSSPRSPSPSTASEKEHRLKASSIKVASIPTRGRLANMALEKGLASRNGRSRSPFIEKRLRSFSRDREQNSFKPSQEQRAQQTIQPQQVFQAGKGASDETQPLETNGVSSSLQQAEKNTKPKMASVRGERSNVAAFWNGKIKKVTSSPKGSTESLQQRQKKQKEDRGKETNSTESKPSSLELMAKLNAVDRANPAQALAQIDFILREESQRNSFEPILINPNVGNDDDSAGTTISSLTNPDYRDWQHQQQMRSNQQLPNQIAPTAVSSFRHPRPSHLQNYSPNAFPKEKAISHITKHPQQSQSVPTTPAEKEKARQLAKLANTPMEAGPNSYSAAINQEGKNQDSTSPPLPRPSPLHTRRSHPWDGDVLDNESIPVSVPPKEERISTTDVHGEVIEQEQTIRHGGTVHSQTLEVKEIKSASIGLAHKDFKMNAKTGNLSAKQVNTKVSTPRITPQQHENSKKISDSFDVAWASMRDSDFAPLGSPKGRQGHGSQSSRSSRTLDLNTSFDASSNATRSYHSRSVSIPENGDSEGVNGERFSIEVSLYNPDSSTPNKRGGKPKSRKQGFLRSLVRRQNGKKGTTSSTNSESQNSTGMHSGSQSSSSAARSHLTPSSMPSSVVSPPSIRNESRQRNRLTAPISPATATHSDSADGFRTASMAQKYSRVMRLYDDD